MVGLALFWSSDMPGRKKNRLNHLHRASLKSILRRLTEVTAAIEDVEVKADLKIAIDSLIKVLSLVRGYYNVVSPAVALKAVMLRSYGLPYKVIRYHLSLSEKQLNLIYSKFIKDKRLETNKRRGRPKVKKPDQGELFPWDQLTKAPKNSSKR